MKRNGNISTNRQYNPRNVKPNIPIDADEVDSAMERFIREKYQHMSLRNDQQTPPNVRHNTGSSTSSNDIPPPLPPKNGPRFGTSMRSASSQYPQSKGQLPSPPASDATNSSAASRDARRMSRIPEDDRIVAISNEEMTAKIAHMRSLGFTDDGRNATYLKAHSYDVAMAMDAMIRSQQGERSVNGISIESSQPLHTQPSQMVNGTDTTASGVTSKAQAPSSNPYNPFMNATQPTESHSLDQAFQNMSLSQSQQPQQPLQQPPYPYKSNSENQQTHQNTQSIPFFRTFTPPVSPSPYPSTFAPLQSQQTGHSSHNQANPFLRMSRSQTFSPSNPFGASMYQQPQPQPQPQQPQYQNASSMPQQVQYQSRHQTPSMPAIPASAQQSQLPQYQTQQQSLFQANTIQSPDAISQANPFYQQQQQPQRQQQAQAQAIPNGYSQQLQQQAQSIPNGHSQPQPLLQSQSQPQYSQQQQQQHHQPVQSLNSYPQQIQYHYQQPLSSQSTGAAGNAFRDKSSILSLYQTAAPPPPPSSTFNGPITNQRSQQPQDIGAGFSAPQRSVTMPLMSHSQSSSFSQPQLLLLQPTQMQVQPMQLGMATGHASRDSVLFGGAGGMMGRSGSPDAFRGLSARWA